MEVQSPCFQPSTSQAQFVPLMFMPYIEGPKMDWTVNDGLYHWFLKWKLKVWEYIRLWTCHVTWVQEVQESHSMEWEISVWINMFPVACPQKIFAWILYRQSRKIFVSHKQMKSEPNLTCSQASGKETDQSMSGKMLYKPRCVFPSTQQKQQVSCIEIYSGSAWKIKICF